MSLVRPRALTDETRKTRSLLMMVSVLMVLLLILGVKINTLNVFGVEISFGRAQLLIALMVANLYLTLLYTTQSMRDQNEQARIFDIASHDEYVGKPIYDRVEQAIEDVESSKRLSRAGRAAIIADFMYLALGLAKPPSNVEDKEEKPIHPDMPPINADEVSDRIALLLNTELRPVEPELAARLMTHMVRMQRRAYIYQNARIESFMRAESFSSLSHLVPTIASTLLTGFTAYALYDPSAIAWFQNQLQDIEAIFQAGGLPEEGKAD